MTVRLVISCPDRPGIIRARVELPRRRPGASCAPTSIEVLTPLGADIERAVLARAVQWHCQDRVVLHGATTVVF